MTSLPVSLPAEHIPPGTPEWRSADTRAWLASVPGRWAHPLWALLALLGTGVWSLETGPVPPCTAADPCGTDWIGLLFAVLTLLGFLWVWRQPRLALAGLAVVLVGNAFDGGFSAVLEEPAALGFVGAVGFTAVTLVHRLAMAGRQQALALAAAGTVTHPLPAAARTFRRGRWSFALAAPLLAVAAFAFWQAQEVVDAYEERAAVLTPVSGEVTKVRDDDEATSLTVAVAGRGSYTIETGYPEDFPVGSTVDVLVDGDWARLVAEPYDVFGWELLVLASSVVGLAFLANGVDGRTRAERLRRGPLPVLRVLVREGHQDGRTWVYAADDPGGERPVLHFHSLYASDPEREAEEREERGTADGGEEGAGRDAAGLADELAGMAAILRGDDPAPVMREAVLYGVPYAGAELAFVSRDDEDADEVSLECSVTVVKPAVPGLFGSGEEFERAHGQDRAGVQGRHRPQGGERRERHHRRPVDEVAAAMEVSGEARSWSANGASRMVGVFLLLVQGGGMWAALDEGFSWSWLWLGLGLPWLVASVATALNWRITADRDGLWVARAWRVRRIEWSRITGVRHTNDAIRIELSPAGEGDGDGHRGGDTVQVSPSGWAWLERRLGRDPYAVRAADELRALLHRPDLRPLGEAPPSRQGMPLGPLLVVVSVVWGAAVLLLL
ncbi:hypothetical protein [Streptomyces sp. NPDC047928]|uniref:hypothetical protein n=1 Tax=unclassified Streptomyces TaxID=2593676 RepID=UPI00372289AC